MSPSDLCGPAARKSVVSSTVYLSPYPVAFFGYANMRAACQGLRTLLVAKTERTEEQYSQWLKGFQEAETSMQGREEKVKQKNIVLVKLSEISSGVDKRAYTYTGVCTRVAKLNGLVIRG